jgi:RHS repeat-associated protein
VEADFLSACSYEFTGCERDAETGLDYAFARYYNARMGRFMSPDPLGGDLTDPQTLNKYTYVRNKWTWTILVIVFLLVEAPLAQSQAIPFDHVRFVVSDPSAAMGWYVNHLGGAKTDAATRLRFGSSYFVFLKSGSARPSGGSVIHGVGFVVANVAARTAELQSAGARVISPPRGRAGSSLHEAEIEDPWGIRIALWEDPTRSSGFYAVFLRAAEPRPLLRWLADSLGGMATRYKGLNGVKFGDVLLIVQTSKGQAGPSKGHVIDQLGLRPANLDRLAAALRRKRVKFTSEVRTASVPGVVKAAFVEAPNGLTIELVQRVP